MNRITNYLSILVLVVTGYAVLAIKSIVHDMSFQLNETERQIVEEQNSLNVLKAEFTYLTSPKRLRQLSERYLQLKSIESAQIVPDLLSRDGGLESASVKSFKRPQLVAMRQVKWRYKKQEMQL